MTHEVSKRLCLYTESLVNKMPESKAQLTFIISFYNCGVLILLVMPTLRRVLKQFEPIG